VSERDDLQAIQDAFYARAELHSHLAYDADSLYARDLVAHVRDAVALTTADTVLEIGAGAGRFGLHLARLCRTVVALDASRALLDALEANRTTESVETLHASIFDLTSARSERTFDVACGFFVLHHLPNHPRIFGLLRDALRPGGRLAFIEPNRVNPSFVVQIACSKEMQWKAERGIFTLSARRMAAQLRELGFRDVRSSCFGLMPPPVLDRFPALLAAQHALERVPGVRRLLPFTLVSATR
jgi:2-polyprenyl-3-methyl-5-hydroxy-6-metoxy-1,4-benzoquinol methylase